MSRPGAPLTFLILVSLFALQLAVFRGSRRCFCARRSWSASSSSFAFPLFGFGASDPFLGFASFLFLLPLAFLPFFFMRLTRSLGDHRTQQEIVTIVLGSSFGFAQYTPKPR